MSHLDSELLRTFLAVADTLNFTKAGELVGRTQSAVSVRMRRLEEDLGESLFDRTATGVVMTKHGHQLLTRARKIILLLDETAASIRGPQLKGIVRIGTPEEHGTSLIPRVLRVFNETHSDVEVIVKFGRSSTNLDAVNSGHLDLAVIYERGQETAREILQPDPTVWATSSVYEQHLRDPLPVAMLAVDTWWRQRALRSLESINANHRICYLSDSSNGLIAGVRAGLGIAPLTRGSIPEDCRELTIAEGYPVIDYSNVVLCQSNSPPSEATLGMANAIRQAFSARRDDTKNTQ
ncbi:LysR substrate-binding domain-containing protein [Mesorhizobium sp.]|uniref:LysR substrate-binding domain-containing protein n=1 Tax=Mesorhizobium sp. TaxID=1871066 RepID=UPI000FE5F90D|nr:LysR substrate-binding domain-containing protein [Mesorhizobium sp.]RWA97312.1 MAG: LysR family transcriptional regulator [Mesorhizobium sp.]